MNCPVDGTTLVMSERHGIEIDYCPSCRGVWLDRGELDKIIVRAGGGDAPAPAAQPPRPTVAPQPRYEDRPPPQTRYEERPPPRYDEQPRRYRDDDDDDDDRRYGKRRRRESWLGDLFDFD